MLSAAILLAAWGPTAAAQSTATVADVAIVRRNVFDLSIPGEDLWLYRLADRIHVVTREWVIRQENLEPPGSPYDGLRALETERNLRALGFIRSASVSASSSPAHPERVDLLVRTQDSWTLAPQFSASTEGGENSLVYGVTEGNLLGMGKSVSLLHSQVGPLKRNEARYGDPRLGGTWFKMTGLFATTPYGDQSGLLLSRPFFSLETGYSADAAASRVAQEKILYQNGSQLSDFVVHYTALGASGGWRLTEDKDFVQRLHAGFMRAESRFAPDDDNTAPGTLPRDRTLAGPTIGYSWVQARYSKETNIDAMYRVEDFNLGNEAFLNGGPMLASLGSDRDRWVWNALDQQGLRLSPTQFLLGQVGTRGRLAHEGLENTILYANLNMFWQPNGLWEQTFVGHLEGNTTRRLDGENQILLGGNSGLRGYRSYAFAGNRSVLLNLEDRFFHDRDYLHLFYLGAAAFFETGAVGPAGPGISPHDYKSDVGFGLRLSPSRSTGGGVIRLDLAYALNSGPGPSRWVVAVRGGQAFSLFSSTNRTVLSSPDDVLGAEAGAARLSQR